MVDQPIYIKIATWFGTLIPAIIGACISLKLSTENSSFSSRLISFLLGVSVAHIVGGAFVDHYNIDTKSMIDDAIILTSGIFGMASATQIYNQLPKIYEQLPEIVKLVVGKLADLIGKSN